MRSTFISSDVGSCKLEVNVAPSIKMLLLFIIVVPPLPPEETPPTTVNLLSLFISNVVGSSSK